MKKIYTIPSGIPFLDALVQKLLRDTGDNPLSLSDYLILLPTRRSALHLREAFRRQVRGPSLLPRMQPLGDIDEEELYFSDINLDIPPAIAPLRRQLLLARLISEKDSTLSLDQAALLAEALARLLDEVQIENCDFKNLGRLVAEKELALHWQKTVEFLEIVTKYWPQILQAEGCIDPADRRNRVIKAQAEAWLKNPPTHPVIAAGSTGSMPATAELLDVISGLPNGAVILPGLDQDLAEDAWQEITETHPQYSMKQMLKKFGVERKQVKLWSKDKQPRPARVHLLNQSMLPAEASEAWRKLTPVQIPADAIQGLTRIDLDHPQEEAMSIALIMRQTLETPNKTASLITPDRSLAERISALLARWDIRVNDSGGTSLSLLPVGGFLIDVLKAAAPQASPVDKLALLKHPLAAFDLTLAECRHRARKIEIDIWRQGVSKPEQETKNWLKEFEKFLTPLSENWNRPLPLQERIQAHIRLAENIAAAHDQKGSDRLWQDEEGETAASWLDDWQNAGRDFPALAGSAYFELFLSVACGIKIRAVRGLHPRLSILGPLEARLVETDVTILGGLNEGVWPPETQPDPWMSRPMKNDFGLPLPERRIGLSAHDFIQLASTKNVVLTRSRRVEGAPSVPSRFLLQLDAVLHALNYELTSSEPWQEWTQMLDKPDKIQPCARPNPTPLLAARPKELSVTEIGTWRRNPYAIYARRILGLKKLDPLEITPEAAERGDIIHKALDLFIKKYPDTLPETALDDLLAIGHEQFAAYRDHPEVRAFWWPRFEDIAAWFITNEQERRADGIMPIQSEAQGGTYIGALFLKGRADRIDRMPDGSLSIADYKTGGVPTQKDVAAGYEPQLPLLGLIAAEGGFKNIPKAAIGELAYWELNRESEITRVKGSPDDAGEKARAGLEHLVTTFADPATPYQAVPKPDLQPRYDDYAHLARLQEWGRTEEDA